MYPSKLYAWTPSFLWRSMRSLWAGWPLRRGGRMVKRTARDPTSLFNLSLPISVVFLGGMREESTGVPLHPSPWGYSQLSPTFYSVGSKGKPVAEQGVAHPLWGKRWQSRSPAPAFRSHPSKANRGSFGQPPRTASGWKAPKRIKTLCQ